MTLCDDPCIKVMSIRPSFRPCTKTLSLRIGRVALSNSFMKLRLYLRKLKSILVKILVGLILGYAQNDLQNLIFKVSFLKNHPISFCRKQTQVEKLK